MEVPFTAIHAGCGLLLLLAVTGTPLHRAVAQAEEGAEAQMEVEAPETDVQEPVAEETKDAANAYGLSYADRGLTMPGGMIRGTFDLTLGQIKDLANDVFTSLNFGAAIAPVDNLEIGFSRYRMASFPSLNLVPGLGFGGEGLITFFVSPNDNFGDIPAYIRYRVVDASKVELAIDATVLFPTSSVWGVSFGLPLRVHFAKQGALDLGAVVWINDVGSQNIVSVEVPFRLVANVTEQVFVKFESGVFILDASKKAVPKPLYNIPLGFAAGYTAKAGRAMIDFFGAFRWPALVAWFDGNSDTSGNYWSMTIGINVYSPVLF